MTVKPSAGELAQIHLNELFEKASWLSSSANAEARVAGCHHLTYGDLAALCSAPAPPSAREELADTLDQWIEAIRHPNNAKLTLVDLAILAGECMSDDVEKAAAALRSSDGWRDMAEDAIIDRDRAERLLAQAGAADTVREPVPLADHDEIGRLVSNQPLAIQNAIVTITAHCTVLTDDLKSSLGSAMIADLAGCISQCCLDLANALAAPPSVPGVERELSENQRHSVAHAKYLCDRATPDDPEVCFDYELVQTLLALIEQPAEKKS